MSSDVLRQDLYLACNSLIRLECLASEAPGFSYLYFLNAEINKPGPTHLVILCGSEDWTFVLMFTPHKITFCRKQRLHPSKNQYCQDISSCCFEQRQELNPGPCTGQTSTLLFSCFPSSKAIWRSTSSPLCLDKLILKERDGWGKEHWLKTQAGQCNGN